MSEPRVDRMVLLDQLVVGLANCGMAVVLVRALGMTNFGAFGLIWLFALLAVCLQQALISQPMQAIGAQADRERRAHYFGATLWLQALLTVTCVLAAAGGYRFVLDTWEIPAMGGTFWPVVAAVAAKQVHAFVRGALFARGRPGLALCTDLVAYPCLLAALVALWRAGRLDVALAFTAIAVCSGVAALQGMLMLRGRSTTRAALARAMAHHWRMARWLAPMRVGQFIASSAFVIAVGAQVGLQAVGAIMATLAVVGLANPLLPVLEIVLPARAARLCAQEGMMELVVRIAEVGARVFAAGAVVVLALVAFARPVLGLLFGTIPPQMVAALGVLATLALLELAVSLLQTVLGALEGPRPLLVAYVGTCLVAILLAMPVVGATGFLGAVVGMVALQAALATVLVMALGRLWEQERHGARGGIGDDPEGPARLAA